MVIGYQLTPSIFIREVFVSPQQEKIQDLHKKQPLISINILKIQSIYLRDNLYSDTNLLSRTLEFSHRGYILRQSYNIQIDYQSSQNNSLKIHMEYSLPSWDQVANLHNTSTKMYPLLLSLLLTHLSKFA